MEELLGGLGQSMPGVVGGLIASQRNQGFAENMFNQQTALANSSHQREVADLRAAGLNPILSAGGGGSPGVPGSVPSEQNSFSGVAQSIQANRQIDQQDRNLKIQKQNADVQEDKVQTDNDNTEEHTKFQKNINDSIETVLPLLKKGMKTIHDVPEALFESLFNLAVPQHKPMLKNITPDL